MDEESVSQKSEWEGQEAMGERLVREALASSPVEFLPLGDRVMIFPVVPDEERPVDIHVVQLKAADLPDMGVVCSVGWAVNEGVIMRLDQETRVEVAEMLQRAEFIALGDIVAVNKFSGMDVPGTVFQLLSRQDVLGKVFNFPVRLRKNQDRWDQVEEKRAEDAAARQLPRIATPQGGIVGVRR